MKKNAIRTRMNPARPVRTQRSSWSGRREGDDRSRIERSAPVSVPASMSPRRPLAQRAAVALQGRDLGLRLVEDVAGKARVLQLRGDLLPVAERVVQPALDELGLGLREPRLAHVLVDEQERGR